MTPEWQPPAQRFVIAQSWWIAGELVRRHPDLRLIETHPGGVLYDCLSLLTSEVRKPKVVIHFNRGGAIHVPGTPDSTQISWASALATDDPHLIVKQLENAAGLSHPSPAPSTSPAALAYRVIARILASLVNDKDTWDARNEQEDSSDGGWGPQNFVQNFPRAAELAQIPRPDDLSGEPGYRFWALLKSRLPVAIFDTDGRVHLSGEQYDLPSIYRQSGRSLSQTINISIGKILP